ncbi:MAG: SoxR reducing system RseC family protein [Dissulfurispiraceae bacterium]|jgi:sigma-E factor negative regulatory protein RseC|nr:SoxR reducing system RseC family protein [Dissulfurispiraceae bacterium]
MAGACGQHRIQASEARGVKMEDIGIVKQLNGGMAVVVIKKHTGCEGCKGSAVCNIGSSGNEANIEAVNQVDAEPGDKVKIRFAASMYLKGALFIYGLPALMLVAGAVAGKELLPGFFNSVDPDLLSAVSGFTLFIVSFVVVKFLLGRSSSAARSVPVVYEIVERAADNK